MIQTLTISIVLPVFGDKLTLLYIYSSTLSNTIQMTNSDMSGTHSIDCIHLHIANGSSFRKREVILFSNQGPMGIRSRTTSLKWNINYLILFYRIRVEPVQRPINGIPDRDTCTVNRHTYPTDYLYDKQFDESFLTI